MKKLIAVVALIACLAGKARAISGAAVAGNGLQSVFIGISTPVATPVNIAPSAGGYIASVILSSAVAAGDYLALYDTATVSGVSSTCAEGTFANPRILTLTATATNTAYGLPPGTGPIPYIKGVVACCKTNACNAVITVNE